MIQCDIDGDGIAHITWDNPNGPVNVKTGAAITAFAAAVEQTIADPTVNGVLIRSAKRDFVAGGDLEALYAVKTAAQAIAIIQPIGACLRCIERGGKPFVAVLNGSALGGGLELALACHYRVVADDARIQLGFPEVTLGLIPGAGGTQRLPRLIGIAPATQLLLEGKPIDPQQAHALGLVDAVVPVEHLVDAARVWALSHPTVAQPWDRQEYAERGARHVRTADRHGMPGTNHSRSHGAENLPHNRPLEALARDTLLHVLNQGLACGIDAGLQIEAEYFGRVAASSAAKNRIRTQFIARNAARKQLRQQPIDVPMPLRKVGVVGAGAMGSGIALVSARAGLDTILLDRDAASTAAGQARIAKGLDSAVARQQITTQQRDAIFGRITIGVDFARLHGCDVVIEAVTEAAVVKRDVLQRVCAAAGPDVRLASNTSTLSITRMAADVAHPGNLIGLHFFAPVDRMALVEVVRGRQTSDQTLRRALAFLKVLGKTAVIVNDGPGFYTSRVVAAYTREALILLGEGVHPARVDQAATAAGFPIGPLAMADLTSYDLLADILGSLARDPRGTAVQSALALHAVTRLVDAGRIGRKGVGGVYQYRPSGKVVWDGLRTLFPPTSSQPSLEDVQTRLLHIQSLETIHAIDDGVASDPLSLDLAAVLGWRYPEFRGGPLAHVDDVGAAAFVAQCDAFADTLGDRFRAPDTLRQRAVQGLRFHNNED